MSIYMACGRVELRSLSSVFTSPFSLKGKDFRVRSFFILGF